MFALAWKAAAAFGGEPAGMPRYVGLKLNGGHSKLHSWHSKLHSWHSKLHSGSSMLIEMAILRT